MELVITAVGIALAVAALVVALGARATAAETQDRLGAARQEVDRAGVAAAKLERSLAELREALAAAQVELTGVRGELEELKAAGASPPPLRLPRSRSGGLEDLREELRAAALDNDEDEEA